MYNAKKYKNLFSQAGTLLYVCYSLIMINILTKEIDFEIAN